MAAESELLELLQQPSVVVAPRLLGAVVRHRSAEGTVGIRLTELEAYMGPADSPAPDPGSHSYRGQTPRNTSMFGPAGHFYVYFTYGMHYCANLVCSPAGTSSGCLMRAGEVVEGHELARTRRPAARKDKELAQGPARLASALAMDLDHNGAWALGGDFSIELGPAMGPDDILTGPRVGLGGPGGSADYPWRFWIAADPTVSRYKPAVVRKRPAAS